MRQEREQHKLYMREWRLKNPDKVRAAWQKSAIVNKENRRASYKRYRERNKEKRRLDHAEWRRKNPEKVKRQRQRDNLRHFHGLSMDQKVELIVRQRGKCLICLQTLSDKPRSPLTACIDHCHTTGKIRGVLCHYCNVALGLLKDDVRRLERAIYYLGRT